MAIVLQLLAFALLLGSQQVYGQVFLVNYQYNNLLDSNTGAATQVDPAHPRPFVYPIDSSAVAPNHEWNLLPQANGNYLIQSVSSTLCLDGNENVPQEDAAYPSPFMWPCDANAPNHRWSLIQVATSASGAPLYNLVNEQNEQALDGNTGAARQADPGHPAPFLWTPTAGAPNQQWALVGPCPTCPSGQMCSLDLTHSIYDPAYTSPFCVNCPANYVGQYCQIRACNCNGVGIGCSCSSVTHKCTYTACGVSTFPGWQQTAACTQECNE